IVKSELISWIPVSNSFINISFLADELSLKMAMIVTGIGALIHFYSIGYMWEDKKYSTYFAYLNLFIFFMLVLVLSANFLTMFVGWEGVGLCSFLLIGFWYHEFYRAKAAQKAFITNRIGDLFFISASIIILSITNFSGLDFQSLLGQKNILLSNYPELITLAGVFLFLSCCGKSAQIPLYVWLPDAMAGPTPVSALIHAATMVTAGVFLFLRVGDIFLSIDFVKNFILTISCLTAVLTSLMALKEYNIKKVLAYSTISQLGYMFCGLVVPYTAFDHLFTHAFFKALLFLSAGYIIHNLHHIEDIRQMGGLAKKSKIALWSFLIGALALAGIPPLSGFFSKENILSSLSGSDYQKFIMLMLSAGSIITTIYIFRVIWFVFFKNSEKEHKFHESATMDSTLILLSVLTVVSPLFIASPKQLVESFLHTVSSPFVILVLTSIGTIFAVLYIYSKNIAEKIKCKPIETLLENKFYVDFMVELLVTMPLKMTAFVAWYFIDNLIIEKKGLEGITKISYKIAKIFSYLQSGVVNNYAFLMIIGLYGILLYSFSANATTVILAILAFSTFSYVLNKLILKEEKQ
ncbi:MAG: NADH-quinone oxidoreductase subunit L, partial [Planctomycetes bacterium]|nr:NADH-quinone oxidoreductase subunit L [Planctomycetota bacterium]